MNVSGVSGAGSTPANQPGAGMQEDSYSKSIQNQINKAREQLQKLSENQDMTPEAKMKKRQEIQQQITELERQLRQHQMEQRKERQQKGTSMEEYLGGGPKAAPAGSAARGSRMSQAGMEAIISADVSLKQAQAQSGAATRLKGREGVLEGEIRQDKALGIDVGRKEEELADIRQRTQELTAAELSTLENANQELNEAAKAEPESGEAEEADPKKTEADDSREKGTSVKPVKENADLPGDYKPVDVRL